MIEAINFENPVKKTNPVDNPILSVELILTNDGSKKCVYFVPHNHKYIINCILTIII